MSTGKIDLVPKRIFAKLFSGSYLEHKRAQIPHFRDLVDFVVWERYEHGQPIIVESLDSNLASNLKDLSEKIGFMHLSYDLARNVVRKEHTHQIRSKFDNEQYYFCNFVVYTKASLDTMAVILNTVFSLGFNRGEIDFAKGIFVRRLEDSLYRFKRFSKTYGAWIQRIVEYRDAIIHKKSIDVYKWGLVKGPVPFLVPVRPFSDSELQELLDIRDNLDDPMKRRRLRSDLKLTHMLPFMKESTAKVSLIAGLVSAETLAELKRNNPDHEPSQAYCG